MAIEVVKSQNAANLLASDRWLLTTGSWIPDRSARPDWGGYPCCQGVLPWA